MMKAAIVVEVEGDVLPAEVGAAVRQATRDLGRLGYEVEVEVVNVRAIWPDDDDDDDLVYDDPPPGSVPVWAWPDGKLHSTPPIDLAAVLSAYQHAREVLGPRPWSPAAEDVVRRLADVWRPAGEGLALVDPAEVEAGEVEAGDWRSDLMAAIGQATGVAPPPPELRPQLDAIAARVRSGETTLEEAVEAVTELRSRHAVESSQLEERSPDRDP